MKNPIRHLWRVLDVCVPVMLLYIGAYLAPADFWFTNNSFIISNSTLGVSPTVNEDRTIHRSFYGSYSYSTRDAKTGTVMFSCTGYSELRYKGGLSGVETSTLIEYAGIRTGCAYLPKGSYYGEVCRTVLEPFWGLVPPKRKCWISNLFEIQ